MKTGLLGQGQLGESGQFQRSAQAHDRVSNHAALKSIYGYVAQAPFHTAICAGVDMRRIMAKSPDDKRDTFRRFMQERGLKISRWAKDASVDKNSIYNFLNGYSQSLSPQSYVKLARAANVPSWQISGELPEPPSPTSLRVVGEVQGGVFREAIEWDAGQWEYVDIPVPERFRKAAKVLRVIGDSMNLEYPDQSLVVYVDMLDFRPPKDGDHVIVYAFKRDDCIEATVKEYRSIADRHVLWPRSDNPNFQMPIDTSALGGDIVSVEIKGIVIGGYRPRVF